MLSNLVTSSRQMERINVIFRKENLGTGSSECHMLKLDHWALRSAQLSAAGEELVNLNYDKVKIIFLNRIRSPTF